MLGWRKSDTGLALTETKKAGTLSGDDLHRQAISAMRGNNPAEAADLLKQAIGLSPSNPDLYANLGRCLIQLRNTNAAAESARRALDLKPTNPITLDTLGVIFSHVGDHEKAVTVMSRAVHLQPDRADLWFNLGASRKFNGDFQGSETAYRRAIALDPSLDKARAALSHLSRQTVDSNNVASLKERLESFEGEIQNEMRLRFALAKGLDDIGEYAQAFEQIAEVSQRWRNRINYSISDDKIAFDALTEGFNNSVLETAQTGYESNEPIFIVGMPRTGTTLTERIVSSHTDIFSAGELNKFGALIRIAAQARSNPDFDAATVRSLASGNVCEIGKSYVDSTRPATGHTPRFIDKMPLNFLYAGFILLALPKAKVICVRRNPMDSCLSNFRQLFSLRSAYYAYSYDLLDCGAYYLMFDRLMQHWDELFPGRIHTVHYEQLVTDQEAQSRALIDYCGLEWQDACLQFEKNAAPVATASSAQVREPIYTSALARWKNYAEQLEPLAEFFAANEIEIEGY